MATNDVLDRMEALLAVATPFEDVAPCENGGSGQTMHAYGQVDGTTMPIADFYNLCDAAVYLALMNAAPALIRLARAVASYEDKGPGNIPDDVVDAIKALGEVRL